MSSRAPNPYATPEADIQPQTADGSAFDDFPRFSAWWVALLGLITQWLYGYYWFYNRTMILNRHCPENPIPNALVITTLTIALSTTVLSFAPEGWVYDPLINSGIDPNLYFYGFMGVVLVEWVLWIVWAFAFRARINQLSGANSFDAEWTSGLLTFFFSSIYLAYKINQIKDSRALKGDL